MSDRTGDLLGYIEASPTPYHAVRESIRRLEAAGFRAMAPGDVWSFSPGDRRYVSRGDGSLIALQLGDLPPARSGFRVLGAHTDSPNLRLKPAPDLSCHGYRQLAVETYGGVLLHTWFDRDLSLAGRVVLHSRASPQPVLIDFGRPVLRIPHLAIHLDREIRDTGVKLNPQQHAVPLLGLAGVPDLRALLAAELEAKGIARSQAADVLAFDLMLYDVQPPARAGVAGEFIWAPRLDNLVSCHAALSALLDASDGRTAADGPASDPARGARAAGTGPAAPPLPRFTRVVVLHDHEEVGSRSEVGAWGPFLLEALGRAVEGFKGGEPQGLPRALASSRMISVDMAHAVHPNYADRHDPAHAPRIGSGPVLKVNANQSYASDARTAGFFTALCREQGREPQYFVSRNDLPCGSTIGPISAARVGIPTVDVGSPMLSMHSCREMAGSADVEPMIRVLRRFFEVEED